MKINIDYIENEIILLDNKIFTLEIENKSYFYRLINDFNLVSKNVLSDNIKFFDDKNSEINLSNKIDVVVDYFNIDFNSKKITNSLYKLISTNIGDNDKSKLENYYVKIKNVLSKSFLDYNLPLIINDEFNIEIVLKLLKVNIESKNNLLDNLFLLIDINNIFHINELIIFVNLKQYLSNDELLELYKYCLYNNVRILLIDSQCYGVTNKFEKKLIIDGNLDEFLL